MKCLKVCVLLFAWASASGLAPVYAQSNPPFKNPSLDSNCYFPQIGDPSEMDTIYGSVNNQRLGWVVQNLGTKPNGSFGNMFIGNLDHVNHSGPYSLFQAMTGPSFNLHNMNPALQHLLEDNYIQKDIDMQDGYHLGHFRDKAHLDLFTYADWRIYWADDDGNYDSSRFTQLATNVRGDRYGYHTIIPPYCTYLTTDSAEDIVIGIYSDWKNSTKDSSYLVLFKGGPSLFQKDTIYEDTSCRLFPNLVNYPYRTVIQGDFRGTGRDDLILEGNTSNGWPGSNGGDYFFYANDPPFSISKLAYAINYDTLMATWQDGVYGGFNYAMPVLSKASGDRSVDLASVLTTNTDTVVGIFIFRGGPSFGSHRLKLDSAAFVITHPSFGFGTDPSADWGIGLFDAGDMTGTGNHVILTEGMADDGRTWWDNFYVTGMALDNKIDIWNISEDGAVGDTLTANADSLEDFLIGREGFTTNADIINQNGGYKGTLQLLYGTKQIPVRLNPQWADVKNIPTENGVSLTFSPNPAQSWSVATIVWPEAENAEYSIYDMLGRQVEHGPIRLLGGAEQQRIYFSGMPQGVYIYTIVGAHGSASARFVKLGGASGSSGSSQPSVIQQMKDARDGNVAKFPAAEPVMR